MAYVLGGDGCGKESIVRTLAYTLAETHNFYYYKFDYDGEILYENSIAIANFEDCEKVLILLTYLKNTSADYFKLEQQKGFSI